MKVFTVTGLSRSGKTTTIENLIKEFNKRGYAVGTVKEIHYEKFAIDTEGKNTYRHRAAGALTVTARGEKETDILYVGKKPIYEILSHYNEDIVILEGVRDIVAPEIACCDENSFPEITPLTVAVSGRFANKGIKEYKGLPVINSVDHTAALADLLEEKTPALMNDFDKECCGYCGYDCRGFLAAYLNGQADIKDCVLKKEYKVKLKIGDDEIAMVPFVQNILYNVVIGVVKELKGYNQNKKIEILIEGHEDNKKV
ncbi:MAG: molybdopterin-guanine dinucleotide biosynthesis protein MobB [Christensenellales bacterium]|jgi:molybdopterin-guanine dinucleotide biosynthesis protein B|nr:molybdopterin-guanine dinucleotide biosynthesis protein [Clostridiales bacterium]